MENSLCTWLMPSEKGSVFFPFLGATMTASPVRLHGLLFLTLPSQESIVPPHLHTFFFAVTRRICVFDRASLEMSWDVTVAFTYPSYLKGSRSKAPQEHICCLWGSKICEPLFYGCGSDKKSQNGSQWLDWDVEPPCLHLYLYNLIYFIYFEYVSN